MKTEKEEKNSLFEIHRSTFIPSHRRHLIEQERHLIALEIIVHLEKKKKDLVKISANIFKRTGTLLAKQPMQRFPTVTILSFSYIFLCKFSSALVKLTPREHVNVRPIH